MIPTHLQMNPDSIVEVENKLGSKLENLPKDISTSSGPKYPEVKLNSEEIKIGGGFNTPTYEIGASPENKVGLLNDSSNRNTKSSGSNSLNENDFNIIIDDSKSSQSPSTQKHSLKKSKTKRERNYKTRVVLFWFLFVGYYFMIISWGINIIIGLSLFGVSFSSNWMFSLLAVLFIVLVVESIVIVITWIRYFFWYRTRKLGFKNMNIYDFVDNVEQVNEYMNSLKATDPEGGVITVECWHHETRTEGDTSARGNWGKFFRKIRKASKKSNYFNKYKIQVEHVTDTSEIPNINGVKGNNVALNIKLNMIYDKESRAYIEDLKRRLHEEHRMKDEFCIVEFEGFTVKGLMNRVRFSKDDKYSKAGHLLDKPFKNLWGILAYFSLYMILMRMKFLNKFKEVHYEIKKQTKIVRIANLKELEVK